MKRAKKPNYRQPVSIACLGLLGLSSVPADAQTKTPPPIVTLPEVVVVGKNAPVPAGEKSLTVPSVAAAQEAVKQIPGGATVVPAEEFKTGRAATLKDVLDYAPGVFTQSRFGSDEARISIRGSGLQRTFHGRGLKLLQDGVPLNLADGSFDMQAIEPLSAEYVEVLRGANALRYGSTTLGGAVNFVTPTGHTADQAQARAEYGSYNYWRGQISTGMALGPVDYYATATHYSTDSFRRHAEQSNQRVFANVGYKLSDNAETRMYFTYVQTYSELPGSITKAQMENDPRQANPGNVTLNQKRNFELVRAANKTTWSQGHNTIELGSFWSHKDLDHPIFQVIDQNSNDFGVEARFRNDDDFFGRRNNFVVGISPTYGRTEDNRFTNLAGRRGGRTGESTQTSYNLDFYGENTHQIADRLSLILGMQVSYANRDFQDRYLADGNQTANPDYLGFNPKVGLRYDFDDKNQVFANVSRSFEPPSFGELSRPPGATPVNGLLQLKAQTATTIEFGTRGSHGRVGWEAVYYHAWLQDELLQMNFPVAGAPPGVFAPTTINANRTTHSGIELGWNVRVLEDISTAGNAQRDGDRVVFRNAYQWNRFRFDGDNAFGNNQLPGMPEHYFRAELTYEHPCGFYAGPNVEWAIQKSPVDMANTLFVDPYAILGLKIGYRVKKGISGYVEVRNVTDERYAATTGVITRATAANGAQFNPGDGRTVYVGLEYKW